MAISLRLDWPAPCDSIKFFRLFPVHASNEPNDELPLVDAATTVALTIIVNDASSYVGIQPASGQQLSQVEQLARDHEGHHFNLKKRKR